MYSFLCFKEKFMQRKLNGRVGLFGLPAQSLVAAEQFKGLGNAFSAIPWCGAMTATELIEKNGNAT